LIAELLEYSSILVVEDKDSLTTPLLARFQSTNIDGTEKQNWDNHGNMPSLLSIQEKEDIHSEQSPSIWLISARRSFLGTELVRLHNSDVNGKTDQIHAFPMSQKCVFPNHSHDSRDLYTTSILGVHRRRRRTKESTMDTRRK